MLIIPCKIKALLLSIFILSLSIQVSAQNFGLGASAMYNFQSEGLGVGIRGNFYPNNRLSFVPQVSYYHIILGTVNELTLGLSLEYKLLYLNKFNIYGIAHGGYNHWLNPDISPMENAQTANWNAEGGLGITTNGCWRPFLEYRYNIKFQETHLQLGLLYIFGCQGGRGNGYRDARNVRNASNCTGF
jgi:hypothetical protein